MLSVGFISLGCAKNLVDSEVIATSLADAGYTLAPVPERADIVVVNTCAFIRDAQDESIAAILRACALKTKGPCRAVLVAGCLPQRYQRELIASLPEVDGFIGLDELRQAGAVITRILKGEHGVAALSPTATAVIEPPRHRLLFTGAPYAYLKIAEGCDHRCTFCAIPAIRGAYRSRPSARIVAEAEALLARGVRELILISQDSTAYGRDLGHGHDLPALLRALGRIGGRFRIRLLYGHPRHVTERLLDTMGTVAQVCRYLDLPIQHSHPAMLRAMGRGAPDGAPGWDVFFAHLRARLPGLALRTTCLVGFPGETEAHVRHLADTLAAVRFDHLGVFVYSREERTPAARLRARVPPAEAEARRARLMRAQQRIVAQLAAREIGRPTEILLERPAPKASNIWLGRSPAQAPEVDGVTRVRGTPGGRLQAGDFVPARFTGRRGYDRLAVCEVRG